MAAPPRDPLRSAPSALRTPAALVDVREGPQFGAEDAVKVLARRDRAAALAEVARIWGDRLRMHAWCILKDGAEAGDVVQEVLIRAMREPRLFEPEFRIQAWLYRVTRNLCFNHVRDRRRREGILAGEGRSEAVLMDPLERVFDEQRQEELLSAIARLSADHRTILMLRYYDDLSYAEIAQALSLKLGTVMSRLSRARDRLLAALGIDGEALA
jgi:RNA polymerase sigma-70 factor (ECF subfamily)